MTEREQLQDLNRELLVLKAEYATLADKFTDLGKRIFLFYDKIDEKLNGKK